MKYGLALPHLGTGASPDGIATFARRAEELGFDSLWVLERLLRTVEPEPVIPPHYGNVFSPLETLSFVAAHTSTIRLGTSIIDALFHVPVLLGRQLATLDHLSGGRLVVGLGQGWSPEEFATSGIPMSRRGNGFEDFIHALQATWGPDPVSYDGRFYRIPPSEVGPKPLQDGGPTVLLAALPGADAPTQRAGRLGLGLNPAVYDWAGFEKQVETFHAAVPDGVKPGPIVIRVNGTVTDSPADEGSRQPLTGSADQIRRDVARLTELGVDEVFWDLVQADVPHEDHLRILDLLTAVRT